MPDSLTRIITERLASLKPTQLILQDDSHLHKGHLGNRAGGFHFSLTIASPEFEGLSILACHRLIYTSLADLIPKPLHALCIKIIR